MNRSRLISLLVFVVVLVGMAACGGGGSSKSTVSRDTALTSSQNGTKPVTRQETTAGSEVLTGSIDLEWIAPVARADGTPLQLSDIGGFHIYYGKNKGEYTKYVNVPDGTTQRLTLRDLPVGTYYLALTTYDVNGLESDYSPSVRKTAS